MKTKKTTTIKSVKIEKLFDIFNYEVQYPTEENVLIITGPNGFGKTQILNILFNLFNRKFVFFKDLVFSKITVSLNNNFSIEISKNIQKEKKEVLFVFFDKKRKFETFNYSYDLDINMMRRMSRYLPIHKVNDDLWMDINTEKKLTSHEILHKYANHLPNNFMPKMPNIKKEASDCLDSINVHLIREQRLFKKITSRDRSYRAERDETIMIETIQTYSEELRKLILERIQESYDISQSLDSSYPNRLISEKKKVSKEEYDQKFADLKEKQDKLMKNGLYQKTQKALEYSKGDAKALLVYLNDLEQKLKVFDVLLEKLELFTCILNERRFTFKTINIDKEKGFYFKTIKGKELKLNQLSSGEQHEVVLLYELIFKTKSSILVLIDEPEISLHISWQKEFLNDLLKIIKIQKFQVLIATHSPSIINDRWDLVYNLEKGDAQ